MIHLDPLEWSREQVRAWLQFTMKQFKITLTQDIESIFDEDGKQLSRLNEIDFINRIPQVNFELIKSMKAQIILFRNQWLLYISFPLLLVNGNVI